MRIIIVPYSVKQPTYKNINVPLLSVIIIIMITPFIIKIFLKRNEFIDAEELKRHNKNLENKIEKYSLEYNNLVEKYQILNKITKYSSVNIYKKEEKRPNIEDISTLINKLEKTKNIINKINEKIKSEVDLCRVVPSISPIKDGIIIQTFGKMNYIFTGEERFCRGIEFAAKEGTEVFATGDGVVEWIGLLGNLGLSIKINHGYGIKTTYSYLGITRVYKGEKVKRGQVIGLVGKTGKTVGPKLHYEVWLNGKPQNPLNFILNEVKFF